jgi:hypothetical protein
MMTISKTIMGVMAALAVSAPAFAHHEATFTASPNASALLIGGAVLVSAIIVAVAIKAMKKKA